MRWGDVLFAASAMLFTLSNTAIAQMSIKGDVTDIRDFSEKLTVLTEESEEFARLLEDINDYANLKNSKVPFTIRLVRGAGLHGLFGRGQVKTIIIPYVEPHAEKNSLNDPGAPFLSYFVVLHNASEVEQTEWVFLGELSLYFDLNDLEKLPQFERNSSGLWAPSDGPPAWAMTQESVIAHEIAEFYHRVVYGSCLYRCDCQNGDNHEFAIGVENKVRKAFGQTDIRPEICGEEQTGVAMFGNHKVRICKEGVRVSSIKYREDEVC